MKYLQGVSLQVELVTILLFPFTQHLKCVEMALEPLKHLHLDNLIHFVWWWQQMGPWAMYEGHQINKTRCRHNGHDCIYKQDLSSIGDIGEVSKVSEVSTPKDIPHPTNTEVSNTVTPD